ncbi:MAG: hypothetical protein IPK13_25370 [Deltaproteobacteria bacterium]|nr:hypothetical protein [Deltaproteobacteria bacterium]
MTRSRPSGARERGCGRGRALGRAMVALSTLGVAGGASLPTQAGPSPPKSVDPVPVGLAISFELASARYDRGLNAFQVQHASEQ